MAKSYCPCKTCTIHECMDCAICDICCARTGCVDDIPDEEDTNNNHSYKE